MHVLHYHIKFDLLNSVDSNNLNHNKMIFKSILMIS